jgi:hypothetical protein
MWYTQPVTVTEKVPELVDNVLRGSPSFLPPKEDNKYEARDMLPGCEEVIWVRPLCIDDPGRNYGENVRLLQLNMRIPGNNWDIEALRQLGTTSKAPISAPLLTGVVDDPLAAEVAIAQLAKYGEALEQELEDLRTPSDPEAVDAPHGPHVSKVLGRTPQIAHCPFPHRLVWCLHR